MENENVISENEHKASALPPATGSSRINVGVNERLISVAAGVLLGTIAIRNFRNTSGQILGVISAILLKRGVTGYCEINSMANRDTAHRKAPAMELKHIVVVNKPRNEVFAFWRNFENLPAFMHHLKDVKRLDERRSKWTARVPGGLGSISWEATEEVVTENSFISWCSIPGSTIDNAGEILFKDAPQNQGTEIKVGITYRLPGGDVGSLAGKLFNGVVEKQLKEDLRRFKAYMETGEVPLTPAERTRKLREHEQEEGIQTDQTRSSHESPVF